MLAQMKYKDFVWPVNPTTFKVETKRAVRGYKLPFSGFLVQDLGIEQKIVRGKGEFSGADAYDSFKRLTEVFSAGGAGWLEHPVWEPMKVCFCKLDLIEEPGEEHISYEFEFREAEYEPDTSDYTPSAVPEERSKYVSAVSGDTLLLIASRYNVTLSQVIRLNPQIAEGDTIRAGQIVRIS